MPSTPKSIEAAKATWNADSAACWLPAATAPEASVGSQLGPAAWFKTVASTATPTELATWRLALKSEEARPVSAELSLRRLPPGPRRWQSSRICRAGA